MGCTRRATLGRSALTDRGWHHKVAGSMRFVYIHAVAFALWMLFVGSNPWPTLTLTVSLEAIFLSTFVMFGQNRQDDFAQRKADHDFHEQETELHMNTELPRLIHDLAKEIHASAMNLTRQILSGSHAAGVCMLRALVIETERVPNAGR